MTQVGTSHIRLPLIAALVALALLAFTAAGAEAKTLKLKGDDTALTLDPGTAAALTGAGFVVTPVGSANARPDGSIAFPITGGRVNSKTLAGFISHSGGLAISKGNTKVTVRSFVIRTATEQPYLTARVGRATIRLLDLSHVRRSDAGGKVVVTARATLAKQAAKALNAAFKTKLFKKGLTIGTAKVTASA